MRDTQNPRGPGACLHAAIFRWTGERPNASCQCGRYIRQMNRWGPAKCRRKLHIIVKWLRTEARQRRWWRYAVTLPGTRFFLRRLVLAAIAESEEKIRRFRHDAPSPGGSAMISVDINTLQDSENHDA